MVKWPQTMKSGIFLISISIYISVQGSTNPRCQVIIVPNIFTATPSIFWSTVLKFYYIHVHKLRTESSGRFL